MIVKKWGGFDGDFLKCATDPIERNRYVQNLTIARVLSFIVCILFILSLGVNFVIGILNKDPISTTFVFILALFVLELAAFYWFDTKIKILKVLDIALKQDTFQESSDKTVPSNS